MSLNGLKSFSTKALHVGSDPDPHTGAVIPPLSLSSTFAQKSPGVLYPASFEYSRSANPTRDGFEKAVAACENAKHGIAFGSGSAALATIVSVFKAGDHFVTGDDVYGGTNRYFRQVAMENGFEVSFVDTTDEEAVVAAFKANTKMLWLESPTNPVLKVSDIASLSGKAKKFNKEMVVVVDNTFLSPYFQTPLDLGADVVSHSVSKYINGHSDVVMGFLATNDDALAARLRWLVNAIGSITAPFDCYMAHRGLKTLAVRMRQHALNAQKMAEFLEAHAKVRKVHYPGLASHPQHAIAAKQQSGYGGMLTFWLKGELAQARQFLEAIRGPFTLAESLGGVESLLEHPAIMTHASVPAEQRAALGIDDSLIRVSVGLEEWDDLKADFEQALEKVQL